jgi:transmembrane sensor
LKTNFNDIDELLVKYLAGEAGPGEKQEVQHWLQQSEANRQYYDHFRLIWEESLQLAATTAVDENAAWHRFQQRTQKPAATVRTLPVARWIRFAAAIILIGGLGWMAWYLMAGSGSQETQLATLESTNDAKSDTLPDGSLITINKHSSISWPQQFTGKVRKVQLTGEGFFAVVPDQQKPFIVHAGNNVIIEVLGTSFNIKSREDSTEVIVETGKVQVSWLNEKVFLQAGEKITIKNGQDNAQKQSVIDQLYKYYRNRTIICSGTPLYKLVNILNEEYNANITIERAGLANEPLTADFYNEPLEKILAVVKESLNIEVVKENGAIILR